MRADLEIDSGEILKYEKHMRRAIELAEMGRGTTSPNPMVGAVILKDDCVIAEGFHRKAGEAHAEINALNSASDGVSGSTMVVSLEPCNHIGRTPPCTEAIINAGIKKVIVGMIDPNPRCAGGGVKRLRDAGIEVEYGLLAEDVARQNEIFIKYITTRRPFVTVKAAISLDGKIAEAKGVSTPITGKESLTRVHRLRNEYDSIAVGIETVMADDPLLTTRLESEQMEARNPVRIVFDSKARLPLNSKIANTARGVKTLAVVTASAQLYNVEDLKVKGLEVIKLDSWDGLIDIEMLLEELGGREISSLIVEGGGRLIASFIRAGLVDKYLIFVAPKFIGNRGVDLIGSHLNSMKDLRIEKVERLGDDLLIEAYPK